MGFKAVPVPIPLALGFMFMLKRAFWAPEDMAFTRFLLDPIPIPIPAPRLVTLRIPAEDKPFEDPNVDALESLSLLREPPPRDKPIPLVTRRMADDEEDEGSSLETSFS